MGLPPSILQGLAIGAPIASGLAQASGIRQQGDAQAAALRYNAQLARDEGDAEATRIRRAGRRELGRQRSILGASGVRVEGTPLELLERNAYEIERDAVNAQIAGRNTARLDAAAARGARRAARSSSATAILSGGLQAGIGLGRTLGKGF